MLTLLRQPVEDVLVYSCILKNFSAFISGAINTNRCSSYKHSTLESLVTFRCGKCSSKSKRFENPCSRSSKKVHVSTHFKRIQKKSIGQASLCYGMHPRDQSRSVCLGRDCTLESLRSFKNYRCPENFTPPPVNILI